jgi:DNA-binding IclR family transcriptional regulator
LAEVFDFGPPFGIRTQAGQSIPLRPPFGAVFVAWAGDEQFDRWMTSAGVDRPADVARYRAALDAVRRRGYSVTIPTERRPDLMRALEHLARQPDADDARRTRDEVMQQMTHSEYLPADLHKRSRLRFSQMSAPVFDRSGAVAAKIMVLGPDHDVTAGEIDALGDELRRATERATSAAA